MNLRPLHDRVIVKRLENETKTASGIYIPDNAAEKPDQGEVLAVGPGKKNDQGEAIAMGVKVGDRVLFGKYSGQTVKMNGEEVFFAHDQQLFAIDLDGLARVLAEQDAIAHSHVQDDEFALVIALARTDGQHFALVRLFGGVVGDDDAQGGLGFLFQALDDHAIVQRTQFHDFSCMS